jgi:hypothetical protein
MDCSRNLSFFYASEGWNCIMVHLSSLFWWTTKYIVSSICLLKCSTMEAFSLIHFLKHTCWFVDGGHTAYLSEIGCGWFGRVGQALQATNHTACWAF